MLNRFAARRCLRVGVPSWPPALILLVSEGRSWKLDTYTDDGDVLDVLLSHVGYWSIWFVNVLLVNVL